MTRLLYGRLATWPEEETNGRRGSPFRAKWADTKQRLLDEGRHLNASEVVVEIVGPHDLVSVSGESVRRDRRPSHPGVVVRLIGTDHGDLRYSCDTFDAYYSGDGEAWQVNARAVALALESLRRLDRYGLGSRGEQYVGWQALPPGTPMGSTAEQKLTLDYAAALLAGGTDGLVTPRDVLEEPEDARLAYRHCAKRWHPDVPGGSVETWAKIDEAWQLVEAHHG